MCSIENDPIQRRRRDCRPAACEIGASESGRLGGTGEFADSQGGSPYRNVGQWFGAGEQEGWQSHTWRVTDARLAKMWDYDFSLRPEQSAPFAIGRVEVSTMAFE